MAEGCGGGVKMGPFNILLNSPSPNPIPSGDGEIQGSEPGMVFPEHNLRRSLGAA